MSQLDPQFRAIALEAATRGEASERLVNYAIALTVADSIGATVAEIGGHPNPDRRIQLRYRDREVGVMLEPRGGLSVDVTVCLTGVDARFTRAASWLSVPAVVKASADDMIALAQEMAVAA